MQMQKEKIMELGNFVGEYNGVPEDNLAELIETLEDGVILPCAWQAVDAEGKAIGRLDNVLGHCEFVSFVEIPTEGDALPAVSGYGLGFKPEFLQAQAVEPVTYLYIEQETILEGAKAITQTIEERHMLAPHESLQYFRGLAGAAFSGFGQLSGRHAFLHQMVLAHANDKRTYCEIIPVDDIDAAPAEDMLHEWRGTAPVHFTLDDIQTIYVGSLEDVTALRQAYPGYTGTFTILER